MQSAHGVEVLVSPLISIIVFCYSWSTDGGRVPETNQEGVALTGKREVDSGQFCICLGACSHCSWAVRQYRTNL